MQTGYLIAGVLLLKNISSCELFHRNWCKQTDYFTTFFEYAKKRKEFFRQVNFLCFIGSHMIMQMYILTKTYTLLTKVHLGYEGVISLI